MAIVFSFIIYLRSVNNSPTGLDNLKLEVKFKLEKLNHKLELLNMEQKFDNWIMFRYANFNRLEYDDFLKELSKIINNRAKEMKEIEKQIAELKNS